MKKIVALVFTALTLLSGAHAESALNAEKKPATEIPVQKNAEVYQLLDFSDEQESKFAHRGLIPAPETLTHSGRKWHDHLVAGRVQLRPRSRIGA